MNGSSGSSSPAEDFLQITAASRVSSESWVITRPFETWPTRWPLLPTLWIRRVTCLGELYWMTYSRKPMSIPSSRLLVQMTPRRRPSFSALSTASLVAFDRELWWTPMGNSGSHTLNLLESASASVLVLVNIRTDLYFSTSSLIVLSLAATSG